MSTAADCLIYGANGYTGELIARDAVARGMRPTLAGRNQEAIRSLAEELQCPSRVFALDSVDEIARQLTDVRVVVHCAGPFSVTARPVMEACLSSKTHYLDITGELDVIEAAAGLNERALAADVLLMPAVGFDVVPTDCLAATLAAELPSATHLELAIDGLAAISPGTAKTIVENLPTGGRVRIDGRIERAPTAWKVRDIPFRDGARKAMTIPWGDVASAYHTTGIGNIEVYATRAPREIKWLRRLGWLLPLAGWRPVQAYLRRQVERRVQGPTPEQLNAERAHIWGRVYDDAGREVQATLETPSGYSLTVSTTLAVLERVLAGDAPEGFQTPARAFGKDLILQIPGTDLQISRPSAAPAAASTTS